MCDTLKEKHLPTPLTLSVRITDRLKPQNVCMFISKHERLRENKGISHDVKGETHTSEFSGAPETKQFDSSDQSSSVFHQVHLIFIFSSFCFCCDKADPGSATLNLHVGLRLFPGSVRFINLEMV